MRTYGQKPFVEVEIGSWPFGEHYPSQMQGKLAPQAVLDYLNHQLPIMRNFRSQIHYEMTWLGPCRFNRDFISGAKEERFFGLIRENRGLSIVNPCNQVYESVGSVSEGKKAIRNWTQFDAPYVYHRGGLF